MKRFFYSLLVLILTALLVASCANINSNNIKNLPADEMYQRGKYAMEKKNSSDAITYFEELQAQYPFSPQIEQTQLNLIYLYYRTGDYASTVAATERYLRLYPQSRFGGYVYYMKGLANFQINRTILSKLFPLNPADRDLDSVKSAFVDFRNVVRYYPDSKYAEDAHRRMIYLRDLLAEHEVTVGQYYLKRGAFVAAANRASYVVRHYQHAPVIKEALVILVKANRALHEDKLADQAQQVLALNYMH